MSQLFSQRGPEERTSYLVEMLNLKPEYLYNGALTQRGANYLIGEATHLGSPFNKFLGPEGTNLFLEFASHHKHNLQAITDFTNRLSLSVIPFKGNSERLASLLENVQDEKVKFELRTTFLRLLTSPDSLHFEKYYNEFVNKYIEHDKATRPSVLFTNFSRLITLSKTQIDAVSLLGKELDSAHYAWRKEKIRSHLDTLVTNVSRGGVFESSQSIVDFLSEKAYPQLASKVAEHANHNRELARSFSQDLSTHHDSKWNSLYKQEQLGSLMSEIEKTLNSLESRSKLA